MIGKVGFGRDFQASKDIDNPVNTFQQLTDDLEESVTRLINPWRKYSLSKVWRWILSPILPSFAAMHKHPGDVAGSRKLHRRHPVLNCIPALSARFALYSDAGLKTASESLQPAGLVSVLVYIIPRPCRRS